MKKLFITMVLVASMLVIAAVPGYATESSTSWSRVGGAFWSQAIAQDRDIGFVNALFYDNGTLYAGTDAPGLWSWSGSSLSKVGGPFGLENEAQDNGRMVFNITTFNDTLYVGTDHYHGTDDPAIWSWSGSSWSQESGTKGLPIFSGYIKNLGGTLYATSFYGVWSWSGISWLQVGGELGHPPGGNMAMASAGFIGSLAEVNGTLYAATFGEGVWSWNGSSWTQVGGPEGLTAYSGENDHRFRFKLTGCSG